MASAAPKALSPYRVLDLTTEIGQYAGRAFAEMGAEVIKIEPPSGDAVRHIGPFVRDEKKPDRSLLWFTLNASKKGVTLNLEEPEGQALLRRLVATADLVLESYPPGYLDELGVGYGAFRAAHPKLVWASITGFGQQGPYRDYKWSDLVGLALGGLLYLWGELPRPPTRARASQAYYHASFGAAFGGMLALYHARRTGRGQHVDVSMQEIVTFTLAGPGAITAFWSLNKQNITRSGPAINLGNMISRVLYACKDGYVAVSTIFGPHFPTTIDLMKKDGCADFLAEDRWRTATRFSPLAGQWQCSQEEADAAENVFANWIARYTRTELLEMARQHELMLFPVNTVADNIDSLQLAARNFYQNVQHEDIDTTVTYPGPPIVLSKTPWHMKSRAPQLGEHNAEVYRTIGVDEQELAKLRAAGVV